MELLTLRQHYVKAMEILSCVGGPTVLPSPANVIVRRRGRRRVWMRNPKTSGARPDFAGKRLDYALSVKIAVEANDRTGYAGDYLRASDDVAGAFWVSIPTYAVCPLCLGRAPQDRGKGRVFCKPCGAFVRPNILQGLVSADLSTIAEALRAGGIPVKKEKGERDERRPLAVRLEADRAALPGEPTHCDSLG